MIRSRFHMLRLKFENLKVGNTYRDVKRDVIIYDSGYLGNAVNRHVSRDLNIILVL